MSRDNHRELCEIKSRVGQVKRALDDLEKYINSSCYGTTDHSIEMIVSADVLLSVVSQCVETIKKFKK